MPPKLDARVRLALGYRAHERQRDALSELERVAAIRDRALGSAHPDTLSTWSSLALLYGQAGRHAEAGPLRDGTAAGWEQVVAERERLLGPAHPRTLHAQVELAYDSLGLLPCDRSPSGHRRYTAHDIARLYRILALRELGFALTEIRAALAGEEPDGLLRTALRR